MHQIGASLTDWGVSIASFVSLLILRSHSRRRSRTPHWYFCFMAVYLSEGLACFGGGFMWASGINKTATHMGQFTPFQHLVCAIMMMGMVAEGLCLILTSRELRNTSDNYSFARQARPEALAFAAACAAYCTGCVVNMPLWVTYQFLHVLAVGLVAMGATCFNAASSAADSAARGCLRQLLAGESLNLVGAVVLVLMDNACTGVGCITEPFPWEASPCSFGTVRPVGSTCPLPEWLNHAAVMHILAILSCCICVPALCTLLDMGWEPQSGKKQT